MIFAHPLQIVRIVSACFKSASVPRPKALTLGAEHLITSFSFVNQNLAIWAWFGIIFEKGDGCDRVRIANMIRVIACRFEFSAVRAGVFFTGGALPSGRYESVAIGIRAAMNEGIRRISVLSWSIPHELTFGLHEIIFEGSECLDLCINVFDLIVNVFDLFVMSDSGLSGRKHGLFLREQNVLLMLSEVSSEEGFCKTEVLKLRMSELSVAEEALRNRDIISAEECLVA